MKTFVKFGTPANNAPVLAEITPCCGYNGLCVMAKTVEQVHFEASHGFDAFDVIVDGWADKVFDPETESWMSATEFSQRILVRRLINKYPQIAKEEVAKMILAGKA